MQVKRKEGLGDPRRRVIFVNRFFYPDESATSQILTDVVRHLAGEGREITVITSRHKTASDGRMLPRREVVDNIEILRVSSTHQRSGSLWRKMVAFATFYPRAYLALLRNLREGDLVVAKTDPPLISVIVALAVRRRRAVQVNWLQDLYPEVAINLRVPLPLRLLGYLLIAIRNRALRFAHLNVVIGAHMLSEIYGRGVDRQRIQVMPNWADEDSIRPIPAGRSSLRKEWGISDDTFVLGYSGNLGRAHEAQTLADAAVRLAGRKDILFLFIGGGSESARLQKLVKARQLSNFLFKPHQPRELLSDSLAVADAHWLSLRPELEGLIVPSKFYGILAAGRPVVSVTRRDGEIASAVRQNGCGLVVEPGAPEELARSIELLADDRELRLRMGERAREASEQRFARRGALKTWSRIVDSLPNDRDAPAGPVLTVIQGYRVPDASAQAEETEAEPQPGRAARLGTAR